VSDVMLPRVGNSPTFRKRPPVSRGKYKSGAKFRSFGEFVRWVTDGKSCWTSGGCRNAVFFRNQQLQTLLNWFAKDGIRKAALK
jgi:hypothetical protein